MKQNQNVDINARNLMIKSPESPKNNSKRIDKTNIVSEKQSRNSTIIQQNKNRQFNRQESPANRNSIKQISFTKFPPLKKNQQQLNNEMQKTVGRKYSEKQNELNTNIFLKDRQYQKKKNVQKKNPLLISNVNSGLILRYKQYKEFLDTVNITNNIRVINNQTQFIPYVAFIGKGNNSTLIKNIFKNRPWWVITQEKEQKGINFVWTQLKQNEVLNQMKSVKFQGEFQDLIYQLEDEKQIDINNAGAQDSDNDTRNNIGKNKPSSRSQSVNPKEVGVIKSLKTIKKHTTKSKEKESFSSKIIAPNTTKQIKQNLDVEKQKNISKKDVLVNPKIWVNHHNLRRIFSQKDMKTLKSISAILQDGGLKHLNRNRMKCYQKSYSFSSHNHLQNNWNLSNKKALFYNVKSYYQAKKINPFDYIPVTFHIEDIDSKQYIKFLQYYNQKNEQINNQQKKPQINIGKPRTKKRNIWLVKPGENTNRGTGISVTQSLQQINEIITKEKLDDMGRPRTHILQQYIMPFLYNKRKFDIRTYICLTSVNGINKGYWFQEGYIRTACKQFNFKNLANKMIHLTNDAVQKKCQDYGKYEPGNKISFADFQRYLDSQQPKLKFWSTAYPEMKKLATDAIKAVYTKIDPEKKQFSFEIFGLDFMIDENFKVWLIEANTNPCLQLSSPLLGRIIPSMVQNAFRIALDPIFPPPHQSLLGTMKRPVIPQSLFDTNKFELVYDEIEEGKELKSLITNTPNIQIFDIEQEQQQQQNEEIEKKNLKLYEGNQIHLD